MEEGRRLSDEPNKDDWMARMTSPSNRILRRLYTCTVKCGPALRITADTYIVEPCLNGLASRVIQSIRDIRDIVRTRALMGK